MWRLATGWCSGRAIWRACAGPWTTEREERVMYDVMEGVRVVEVAEHTFVPAASMILADWGADVVRIGFRADSRRRPASAFTTGLGWGPHRRRHPRRGDRGRLVPSGADRSRRHRRPRPLPHRHLHHESVPHRGQHGVEGCWPAAAA